MIKVLNENEFSIYTSLIEDREWAKEGYKYHQVIWYGYIIDRVPVSVLCLLLDENKRTYWLSDAYTLIPHRRKGYMAALIRHVIEISRISGLPLELRALDTSKALLERLGFTPGKVLTCMTFTP